MPRLLPRVLHHARKIDPLLPLVLQATRDLASAKNELRWLKEFVIEQQSRHPKHDDRKVLDQRLRQVCIDRARGKPLQYIMGSEYFGDLEISCEKGVLIPRQETATSVTHLIILLHHSSNNKTKTPLPNNLKLLDLCTGTGCIPLLSHYLFTSIHKRKAENLEVVGVDISPLALKLAKKNLQNLIAEGTIQKKPNLRFLQADVLSSTDGHGDAAIPSLKSALEHYNFTSDLAGSGKSSWDIIISNPPYISPQAFARTTTRSVKRYEPRLALVPPYTASDKDTNQGDLFYPHLLSIAASHSAKIVLFEVADLQQAIRVSAMAIHQNIWDGIQIWRDDPMAAETVGDTALDGKVKVVGQGHGRSVVVYRGVGKQWLGVED
ncbi:S-adenosyl-L-methionine-dependent methyltransferase [Aureobasidium namibiae CBS 147.97]|uniref:S-adenosyl-L-methionine-dependent methyltransferase n=1 Tax=Aureobasidium namibiae CBS 147.97 TaxID=1043004 RepID=A0A074WFL5_9PEZI|nr:S-adenosyl-L-methionine-dependent methyltransferase [Aureobasidium namibiae CBS 147.97]KEQ68632.1 S-adenosyl-L-methionine-dependent methyltransferase [Aureobasidium namibiae CBS 147.97]